MREEDVMREARKRPELEKLTADNPEFLAMPQEVTMVAGEWPGAIVGTKRGRCKRCDAAVAISPRSQEVIAKRAGKTAIICFACWERAEPEQAARVRSLL